MMRRSISTKKQSAGIIETAVKARIIAVSALWSDWNCAVPKRQRVLRGIVEHQQRQQVGVPAADERQDPHGDQRRPGQRHQDAPEEAEPRAAVDDRGVLELTRDRAHERPQDDDGDRQPERHLREDDRPRCVQPVDVPEQDVQRQDRHGRGEQQARG